MIRQCARLSTVIADNANWGAEYCQVRSAFVSAPSNNRGPGPHPPSLCDQAFAKNLADVSKSSRAKSAWTPNQAARYRRLQENARLLSRLAKSLEREVEMVFRETDNLSSPLGKVGSQDISKLLQHSTLHARKIAEATERIIAIGSKHKFNMPGFRKQRVRKLLKPKAAREAYEALKAQMENPRPTTSTSISRMLLDKNATPLLEAWNRNWRQLMVQMDESTSMGKAIQAKLGKVLEQNPDVQRSGSLFAGTLSRRSH